MRKKPTSIWTESTGSFDEVGCWMSGDGKTEDGRRKTGFGIGNIYVGSRKSEVSQGSAMLLLRKKY